MSVDPVTMIEGASVAIELVETVLREFFPEADHATILRFAAEKLPTLLPSPKEELSDYDAARKVATSER